MPDIRIPGGMMHVSGDYKAGAAKAPECRWALDDDEANTWQSSCGELWSFIDGGPSENRVTYCHHCGGKVVLEADKEPT